MAKALLVMDMQEVTVGVHHAAMFAYPPELLERVNGVIRAWDGEIVYVRNLMKNNLVNRFAPVQCFPGTREAELAEGLCVRSRNIFDKYAPDAFSNPELASFLQRGGVDEIQLVGVDGGGCVALTALGACRAGYAVRLNTAAIGTIFSKKRDAYYAKLRALGARIE